MILKGIRCIRWHSMASCDVTCYIQSLDNTSLACNQLFLLFDRCRCSFDRVLRNQKQTIYIAGRGTKEAGGHMCIARGGLAAMWADERPSSPGTLHVGPDTCELTPGTLYIGPCSWVTSIPFGATFLDSFELLPIHFDSVRFSDMGRGGREGERGGGVVAGKRTCGSETRAA